MSPPTTPSQRTALIALVLVCLTVWGGYSIGKDLAQRDHARAVAAAS